MRIAIGADHAGYSLKAHVVKILHGEGYDVIDLGTFSTEPVDYPDYALSVGNAILNEDADRGILICGSGAGVTIAANKIRGIRAALCHDAYTAHQSVEHDNANVLCLGPRVIGTDLAMDHIHIWLKAEFSGEERHLRRLAKIDSLEEMEATS